MAKAKAEQGAIVHAPQAVEVSTPSSFIQEAIGKGLSVEHLERLVTLHDRWQKEQARVAFMRAFSEFQSSVPVLEKTKKVEYPNKSGGKTFYKYAPLSEIAETIKDTLKLTELSYRWEFTKKDGIIECTCIVSHSNGHSERSTMVGVEDTSGNKNAIQSVGSTMTYLQRYTLIAALGITTADEDNDAQDAAPRSDGSRVNSSSSSSSGVFDPLTEKIGFGKHAGTEWAKLPLDYLNWLFKEGRPDSRDRAEVTLRYIESVNQQATDPLQHLDEKKVEPKPVEKGLVDDSIKAESKKLLSAALDTIQKATTAKRLETISANAGAYLATGQLTQADHDEIVKACNSKLAEITKGGAK